MYTLLLDSGNIYLNVGLAKDNKLISKISYPCFQKQSELMIPEINRILIENNVDPKRIDEVIVTIGPGSYTGIRIALTIAKVYAYSLNIPCYALSSLMCLEKENIPSICLINARSNRSYFGVYLNNEVIIQDKVLSNDEVKEYIKKHEDYRICGDSNYLSINSKEENVLENMLRLKNDSNKVKDIMKLKAVYLKD